MSNSLRFVRKRKSVGAFSGDFQTRVKKLEVKSPCLPGQFLNEQSQQILINLYVNLHREGEEDEKLIQLVSQYSLVSVSTVRKIVTKGKSTHYSLFNN